MDCPFCESQEFVHLGRLGRLDWFRCRACGAEFAVPADGDPASDEDLRSWDQLGEDVVS